MKMFLFSSSFRLQYEFMNLCSWYCQSLVRAGCSQDVRSEERSQSQSGEESARSDPSSGRQQARLETQQTSRQQWRHCLALALVGETPAKSGDWEEDRVDPCPRHHQHQRPDWLPEGRDQDLLVEDRMWWLGGQHSLDIFTNLTQHSIHYLQYIVLVVAFVLTRKKERIV